eukprot:scaffold1154_cov310-Pinguiococcus_pyrenoidosus.AAC.16
MEDSQPIVSGRSTASVATQTPRQRVTEAMVPSTLKTAAATTDLIVYQALPAEALGTSRTQNAHQAEANVAGVTPGRTSTTFVSARRGPTVLKARAFPTSSASAMPLACHDF